MPQFEIRRPVVAFGPELYMLREGMEDGMSPFDEGVVAAETGMSRDDNPYRPGTDAHSDWNAGYQSAVEADKASEPDGD
jgi:hypothetical protein